MSSAAALLRRFEGFRDTPYWDVNAFRTGYGSDTITRPDGSVVPVQQGMRVSRDDAERDMARRLQTEFTPRARDAVGPAWDSLPPQARDAMLSVTYNYGKLPGIVAKAAQSGNPNAIADAVAALAGHNKGVNAGRRRQEAEYIRTGMLGGRPVAGAPQDPSGPFSPPPMAGPPQPDDTAALLAVLGRRPSGGGMPPVQPQQHATAPEPPLIDITMDPALQPRTTRKNKNFFA